MGKSTKIILDTGALIALEGGRRSALALWAILEKEDIEAIVPTAVVAEWWRKGVPHGNKILKAVRIEPLTLERAKKVGEARSSFRGDKPGVVDVIVMAVAAEYGAVVYTSDLPDLRELKNQQFPEVGLFSPEESDRR